MTKDNAIKLALEALEESKTNNDSMEFHDRKNKAITVLREAQAEQPELWKPEDHYQDGWRDALQSVQKTLAQQPAQQLVDCHVTGVCVQSGLRAEQPAQQEPYGYVWFNKHMEHRFTRIEPHPDMGAMDIKPIYTSPPARKPLTDDTCKWARPDSDHMPDTWEASCGAMWTFTEGGPKDNDMHFCPNCGKPAIEAAHGIKEST